MVAVMTLGSIAGCDERMLRGIDYAEMIQGAVAGTDQQTIHQCTGSMSQGEIEFQVSKTGRRELSRNWR